MLVAEFIARVRRAMPRNADVMAICDEVEKLARPSGSCPICASRRKSKSEAQKRWRYRRKAEERRD